MEVVVLKKNPAVGNENHLSINLNTFYNIYKYLCNDPESLELLWQCIINNTHFFKRFDLLSFRGEGKEKEGEKLQCVVAPHAPPTGHQVCNPGMCRGWESILRPFEPHQPGPNDKHFSCSLPCSRNTLGGIANHRRGWGWMEPEYRVEFWGWDLTNDSVSVFISLCPNFIIYKMRIIIPIILFVRIKC